MYAQCCIVRVHSTEESMFEPTILNCDYATAEVQLPASGIMLTFRCMSKTDVDASSLIEVARMKPGTRLRQSILVSAGSMQVAKRVAAEAIREYRVAYSERHRERFVKPFQMHFSFW